MRIRWTVPAADDLQNIKDYLQRNHLHFAEPTVRAIYHRIRLLKNITKPRQTRSSKRNKRTGARAAPLRCGATSPATIFPVPYPTRRPTR
jgi:hypothetical protein